jgi:hypothetical protein
MRNAAVLTFFDMAFLWNVLRSWRLQRGDLRLAEIAMQEKFRPYRAGAYIASC